MVVKKYTATDIQKEAAKTKAAEIIATLDADEKAKLFEQPLLLVEVPRDDRADESSETSIVTIGARWDYSAGANSACTSSLASSMSRPFSAMRASQRARIFTRATECRSVCR